VSYDINYRPSLWAAAGGVEAVKGLTEELVGSVDVLFGVETAAFADIVDRLGSGNPDLAVVAAPRRVVHSASSHDWGGVAWSRAGGVVEGTLHRNLAVLDRVGGGDGFAAGVVYGLLEGDAVHDGLELGIAHGALVMTTPGDTSSIDVAEVRRLASGGRASVIR
jgi:2-dehydro-3-deoxygluconokinase